MITKHRKLLPLFFFMVIGILFFLSCSDNAPKKNVDDQKAINILHDLLLINSIYKPKMANAELQQNKELEKHLKKEIEMMFLAVMDKHQMDLNSFREYFHYEMNNDENFVHLLDSVTHSFDFNRIE